MTSNPSSPQHSLKDAAEVQQPATKRPRSSPIPNSSLGTATHEISFSLAHARAKIALLINPRQIKNPLLRHIRHVRTEIHNIVADFSCGPTTQVLYISLQYHNLHPEYIYARVRQLPKSRLRILLVLVDVIEHRRPLHELTKLALINDLTLICTSTEREAARYLETFRSYDSKGAESIQQRVEDDYPSRLNAALSSIRGVNKTDVSTLAFTFGALKNLAPLSQMDLRKCPGLGERKVTRLYAALHQPFRAEESWKIDDGVAEDDNGDLDVDAD